MKIAIITEHVHRRGGQERVIAELAGRLCDRHEVHIFCFSAADIPLSKVRVHRLPAISRSAIVQSLWIILLTALVVRPRRFDVVLSQGGNAVVQNFTLVHTCHGLRTPMWRSDGARSMLGGLRRLVKMLRGWLATWLEGRAVRRCAGRVIAVSQSLREYIVSQHGVRMSDVHVVNNGVDHAHFNQRARQEYRAPTRSELGIGEDEFVVLFVGGRWDERGVHLLIEAVGLMERRVRLVIVGDGDEPRYSRLAAEHGVGERVSFHPPTPHVERFYAAADCFAFLPEAEGFGLVLAEAAACGLPLVMTRVGIADELVEEGVSGFIVTRAPSVIAERLDELAADPARCRRMGAEASRRSLPLTWDAQAEAMEWLFRHGRGSVPHKAPFPAPRSRQAESTRDAGALSPGRVRLAVISHSCVVPTNQGFYAELARISEIEPLLIAPLRWWSFIDGPIVFSALRELDGLTQAVAVHLPGHPHAHWYARQLATVLEDFAPDAIFVDEEPYSLCARQALAIARRLGCKLIFATKENLSRRFPPPFAQMQQRVLRESAHAIVVTGECERVLRGKGYSSPITEIPHGIDPGLFSPASGEPMRRSLGLHGPVVGYVGRLAECKGVLDLLKAAEIAQRTGATPFELLLVGDGPLRHRIPELARVQGLADRVTIASRILHDAIPSYLNAMDLLVLPSHTTPRWKEQFGRVVVEALACGVPVIGSSSGHIPDLVADTGGGLVFPEKDCEALAGQIEALLAAPTLAREYGQRGRRRVLEAYTWEAAAQGLADAVMDAVGSAAVVAE
jgi:glycosyltransferase involved in cell wall biosynthesis